MAASPRQLGSALGLALALAAAGAAPARAASVEEPLANAEERIAAAAAAARRQLEEVPGLGELVSRVHLGGSWIGAGWRLDEGTQLPTETFRTWDARVFADVELARDLAWGELEVASFVGVSGEWQINRLGHRSEEFGETYLDVRGIAGSAWLNAQFGRFQIPVGENYLRFDEATPDNPFISNTVGGAWWWDEGVRVFGSRPDGRFGYVASYTSGEGDRNYHFDGPGQLSLKLWSDPLPWLHLSLSALRSGALGSDHHPAQGALWLGETWATGFGSVSPAPNLYRGRVVPDGPGELDATWYGGADAILTHPRGVRLWLSYGAYAIDSSGPSRYDRLLHGWVAELLLSGRLVSPELQRFYLAARAGGIGTYDRDEGYVLDIRYTWPYGYNMRSLTAWSLAAGVRLTRWVDFKLEYTWQDVDLVRGAGRVGLSEPDANYFGFALGFHL